MHLCQKKQISKLTTPTFQNCLLKRVVLYKKENFRVFESSDIRYENKQVNKNHFASCEKCLSINLSKIYDLSRPLFKTLSAQSYYFG